MQSNPSRHQFFQTIDLHGKQFDFSTSRPAPRCGLPGTGARETNLAVNERGDRVLWPSRSRPLESRKPALKNNRRD